MGVNMRGLVFLSVIGREKNKISEARSMLVCFVF